MTTLTLQRMESRSGFADQTVSALLADEVLGGLRVEVARASREKSYEILPVLLVENVPKAWVGAQQPLICLILLEQRLLHLPPPSAFAEDIFAWARSGDPWHGNSKHWSEDEDNENESANQP